MKPISSNTVALLLALSPLTLTAPLVERKDTLTEFTYRLTLFSSASCGSNGGQSASLTVLPSGTNDHFTKPLSGSPKSVRVQGLTASCDLSLITSSGASVAVNAANGCTKLPAGGDDGFVRVSAECDY